MISEIKSMNFDYLHGALGFGIYFLSRIQKNRKVENYLIELVNELEKESKIDIKNSLRWPPLKMTKDTKGVISNLSLSHGMASIIVFLSKVYNQNILKEKNYKLLDGAITYILSNHLDSSIFYSCFPSMIVESEKSSNSRLAWCYGDLGIGMSFIKRE